MFGGGLVGFFDELGYLVGVGLIVFLPFTTTLSPNPSPACGGGEQLPQSAIIAVVGTGAMGAGIAQVAAAAGHPVKLLDARPDAAARAVTGIREQFAKMAAKGKLKFWGEALTLTLSITSFISCK